MPLDSAVLLGAVVEWALPAALSALAGRLLGRASALRARRKAEAARDDALADGVRSLLRCELVRAHAAHVARGEPLDVDALEYVQRTYSSYRRLGGNDVGTHLYRQIVSAAPAGPAAERITPDGTPA